MHNRFTFYFLAICIANSLLSCNSRNDAIGNEGGTTISPKSISIQEERFIDNYGRQVILHGINVVNKSKEENYLYKDGPEFYANLRKWGFNNIRFILIWDGLEPEPGEYNEEWLLELDKSIGWAADNGLFVVLDMHQDLYSVKYSDGAPEWATLDEGKQHVQGEVWSDAYLLSPAVQTAFDNFWANAEAPDGIGLQDHYARLWQHIAERYADNPTVIGYDIMNEPFPGSPALEVMPLLLEAYGTLVYKQTGELMSEQQLMETWSGIEGRMDALKRMSNIEDFAAFIDALYPVTNAFETQQLQPFYQKVADAIREVDTGSLLFLEHNYFCNMGVASSITRTTLPNGEADPKVVYAPHGYDLVTDTDQTADAAEGRVGLIFERAAQTGKRLKMPIWMGEWGAYYGHDDAVTPAAQFAMSQIEGHLFGQAYWSYDPGLENQDYFRKVILRPYPAYIQGELVSYSNDRASQTFSMSWREFASNKEPTVIYIPDLQSLKDVPAELYHETLAIDDSPGGWLLIHPGQKDELREIVLHLE